METNERPLSLMELDQELERLLAVVVDGEMSEDMDARYMELMELAVKKCDGYVWRIVKVEAENEAYRKIWKEMGERITRRERNIEALRERLATFMENRGIKRLEPENQALPKVVLMPGREKVVYEEKVIPKAFWKKVPQLDKAKIGEVLKEGGSVPGVMKVVGSSYLTLK